MGKATTERERRLTEVVTGHGDAFAMGVCDGLAQGVSEAIRHHSQTVAVALVARGRRLYGPRFEAELTVWRLEVTEAGEIRFVNPQQNGQTERITTGETDG